MLSAWHKMHNICGVPSSTVLCLPLLLMLRGCLLPAAPQSGAKKLWSQQATALLEEMQRLEPGEQVSSAPACERGCQNAAEHLRPISHPPTPSAKHLTQVTLPTALRALP
jgi:hypothetical protein